MPQNKRANPHCGALLPDIHLVFGGPVPQGGLMHFWTQCRHFTLTCRGSAGHVL